LNTAGPSVSSFAASTGQQQAGFPAGSVVPGGLLATTSPFIPASSSATAGQFAPIAGTFAAAPALGENFLGPFDDFFGDESWAAGFDGFN